MLRAVPKTLASNTDRALMLARAAGLALDEGRAKDAAWLALYALEVDPGAGLAWGVVSRVLVELTQDPLGTIAARHALELGVPAPERTWVERHHRIDLWTRGLVRAASGASILHAGDFDDGARFADTARKDAWYAEQLQPFGGAVARAAEAARRMVAAFADAWEVPSTGDENPLHSAEPWAETEEYAGWRAALDDGALAARGAEAASGGGAAHAHGPEAAHAHGGAAHAHGGAAQVAVLSDHWIEVEIVERLREGQLDAALERATLWTQLRPGKLRPRAALLRVQHTGGLADEAKATARAIIEARVRDLNELEEARVAFGELGLWAEQLDVLAQMDRLAPGHPVILTNRGVALLQLGERDEGVKALERALELDPTNGPALANLGLERMRQDEYVAARRLLERAVEVAPTQPEARLYLAACKNNQGDRRGALDDLARVLELDPENAQAKQLKADLEGHAVKRG